MEVIQVNGIPTETYSRRSREINNTKIVLIPGNPGVVQFYTTFVDTLFDQLHGKYDITAVEHAGHSGLTDKVFLVEDQIQHKADYLSSLSKETVVVLLGHSVGAYIMLKIMKRRASGLLSTTFPTIASGILLMPTLRQLYDGLAPAVKLVMQPGLRHALSTLVHLAPQVVTRGILSVFSSMSQEACYFTASKIKYYSVMNSLSMAHNEAHIITDLDKDCCEAIQEFLPKLYFYYASKDQYVPSEFREEIRTLFPQVKMEICEVSHAFVLNHSHTVAKGVSSFLLDTLK